MKRIKGKLVKRSSQNQLNVDGTVSIDWTKYDERLLECVEHGDTLRLRSTLSKKGVSAVKLDPYGTTALHTACQRGNIECLDVLLEEGPNLNAVDKSGCNALVVAAKEGQNECVQRMLDHHVDVNSQDAKKMTALHHTAAKGHLDTVDLLIRNNGSLNIVDKDGRTPLLMGIQSGHEDVVKLLLDKGAKVNIADNAKKTALMYASLLGLKRSIETLLRRGANSQLEDGQGHTAKDYARMGGYKDIISLIHDAPTVATWDAGDDSEQEEEEEKEIPNGELVSEFTCQDDSQEMSITSNATTRSPVRVAGSVTSDGTSSLQESFSSKASTAISSPRIPMMHHERDLTIDIKELEEENEMLNQELSKLRIQHQKTLERLRFTETELDAERKKSPSPVHINGSSIEEDLIEVKERKIEDLEQQITQLQVDLHKEKKSRREAEDDIETLNIQVASYQEEDGLAFTDDHDIDLPGVDVHHSPKNDKKIKAPNADLLMSLNGQITTLKIENQNLKEKLKSHRDGDVNHNDNEGSIPLQVYEHLKESTEEEIFKFTERIEELKMTNELLQQEARKGCTTCGGVDVTDRQTRLSADNSHKTYLESEVNRLKQKIKETTLEYERRINVYRLHLITAVQGELDRDVDQALQEILGMRASEQFC